MNDRIKTKYLFASCDLFYKELKCYQENYVKFKYTCSFQRKMLPNLKCVLICSSTKFAHEDGFKDNCSENSAVFAEKYLC